MSKCRMCNAPIGAANRSPVDGICNMCLSQYYAKNEGKEANVRVNQSQSGIPSSSARSKSKKSKKPSSSHGDWRKQKNIHIATRIPTELYEKVIKKLESGTDTVSAYIRELIEMDFGDY